MNEDLLKFIQGSNEASDKRKAPLYAELGEKPRMRIEILRSLALVIQIAAGVLLGLSIYGAIIAAQVLRAM